MKKKFVFTLPILFIFICLIPQISYAQETSFIAKKGILDLTTAEDSQHILSGEWEFYWNELLTPEDIIEQTAPKTYADVPNQWHNLNVEGERLDRFGYATYRLTILFPEKEIGTIKALSIPNIASSYKVWINGELIGKVGKVGTSEITSEPTNVSSILSFIPHEEATELVIQVSNFAQRKSGIWSNIELGNHQDILNSEIQYLIITGIIVGGLFIIGIYHFVMFTFRRKEKISVFFSLTCIGLAIRILFLEGITTSFFYPNTSWELELKFEYISTYFAMTFFNYYLYYFLGYRKAQNYLKGIMLIHCILTLFVLLTPGKISTLIFPYYSILSTLLFINLVILSFKAYLKNKEKAYLYNLIAICFFSFCLINDCLYYLDFVHTTDLLPVGLLVYILFQAILLSARISNSFNKEEILRTELSEINSNLENIVKIRTEEIVVINNQLQNALDARIELISTISHEMRSPLTTIKSYAKGMIDKIIKDDNHQYTQTIYEETNFMERMLDDLFELSLLELGQYKFYYENVEPIAYFKKLFEKYQYEVAQSGLQFHFYVQENESVEIKIDPIRMEQVFINLLRNALKNTEKGSISIEVSCESSFVSFSIIDTAMGFSRNYYQSFLRNS